MTTDPVSAPTPARARRQSRLRERSVLLNPVPVVAATLAAFALTFGGLTARLVTGHDPALGTLASVRTTAGSGGTTTLSTRTSAAATSPAGPTAGSPAPTAPLLTATSGRTATAGHDDA